MQMSKAVCAHCRRNIDDAAKVCPYCGADPVTGERVVDTQAMLQEVFRPKEMSKGETVLEYARQRQGIVIAVGVAIIFLVFAITHSYISARNAAADPTGGSVPLTEVTDLSGQPEETQAQAMPELQVQMDGNPQRMRQFVVEPGAVAPPPDPNATPAPATTTTTATAPTQAAAR